MYTTDKPSIGQQVIMQAANLAVAAFACSI